MSVIVRPMSSEDFNSETIEMNVKERMSSMTDDFGEEFVPDIRSTQTPTIIDDIDTDIKYEDVDYHHNSTARAADSEDDSDVHETVPIIAHIDGDSTKTNEKDLNDFYLDLLQCERDCETCQKYIRKLHKHVKAIHAPRQSIQDIPLINPPHIDIDPPHADQPSSSTCTQSEVVDESIVKIEPLEEERNSMYESDPHYGLISGGELDYSVCPDLAGALRRHSSEGRRRILSLLDERPFKCNICSKRFTHKHYLEFHMRSHTGEKPFKCDECEKSFSLQGNLKVHQRLHTAEKRFKCDECGLSFSTRRSLTLHHLNHNGEKPHVCDACGKSFSLKSNLTAHMRIHTGEKPFVCEECDKCFTIKSSLMTHMRVHRGEKPFQCDECEKAFTERHSLNRHKGVHARKSHYITSVEECLRVNACYFSQENSNLRLPSV